MESEKVGATMRIGFLGTEDNGLLNVSTMPRSDRYSYVLRASETM